MLRVVFEPMDTFEWSPNIEYGTDTWKMLEAWAGETLELSTDGTVTFGVSTLRPGDVIVKARTPGAAAFVCSQEDFEQFYVTTPSLPQT